MDIAFLHELMTDCKLIQQLSGKLEAPVREPKREPLTSVGPSSVPTRTLRVNTSEPITCIPYVYCSLSCIFGMAPEDLPRAVLAIFVVLVIALALGSVILNTDLTALIDPLTEIFVPIFLLAIFIGLIWAVISSFL